nr:single-strand selective monofunctional uracil DNA glycosylase [Ciona intestinalis]|eukprot:XP_002120073.1 single-strand selective monofunctional uracil DNA glycosylase [Ciona intestinalis]
MENMDVYFQHVMKQRQQQHQQECDGSTTFGNIDFSPFSHLSTQTAGHQPGIVNLKQTLVNNAISQDYFQDDQWKERQAVNVMQGQLVYNNNNNTQQHAIIANQQQTSPNYNMVATQGTATPFTVQPSTIMSQDTLLQPKVEPMDQVLVQHTPPPPFTIQESVVINQHQELDSQQEQVMSGSEYGDENFNSQIVLAFLWIEAKLCAKLKYLSFCERVAYVYNPLEYASDPHAHYVSKYCGTKNVLFLGMNPGPNGMAQNGVPFGDTRYVREWLKISGEVHPPTHEHPKRPIQGLECPRSEVSGSRFWGFIAKLCGTPERFFQNCFVHNYCPLAFMTKTGKNIIPAALPAVDRRSLEAICDSALLQCVRVLRAQIVVAVGKYAADRVTHVLRVSGDESSASIRVERILHPSPASPQANTGWEEIVTQQLRNSGVLQHLQQPC